MYRKPSTVLGVHVHPSTKRTGELSQHKSGQSPGSAKETPVLIDSKVGLGDTGAPLADDSPRRQCLSSHYAHNQTKGSERPPFAQNRKTVF